MSEKHAEDPFDLQRFVDAQNFVYAKALDELRMGRKQTHWIWFIFPQAEGLGSSSMAQHYAIRSRDEASRYLAQPLLRARLVECTKAVLEVEDGKSAYDIFGSPDDMKFRSSMTLFKIVGSEECFRLALDRFYEGKPDEATITILKKWGH
jgi:uncharacterized protein (DUF1810 family)